MKTVFLHPAGIRIEAALILLLLFAACDHSNTLVEIDSTFSLHEHQGPPVTAIEGRLVFADITTFASFMEGLIKSESASLGEKELADDFISLHTSTRVLQDEDYEKLEDAYVLDNSHFEIVEDPFFAKVLNEHGEIQIGPNVFKITRNYVYQALESDIESIKSIILRNDDQTVFLGRHRDIRGVSTHEIERAVTNTEFEAAGKVMAEIGCTKDFQPRRRIQGISWITDFGVYQSAGVRTRAQRRRWFRWRSATVEEVSLVADFTLTNSHSWLTGGATTRIVELTDYSTYSHVARILMYDIGPRGFIYGDISTKHSGIRDNGRGSRQSAYCNTEVSV